MIKIIVILSKVHLRLLRETKNEEEQKMAGKFEVYQDKGDKYRFRLKAGNGQVIATGQGYASKESCLNGIESIKKNAPDAPIVEVEE